MDVLFEKVDEFGLIVTFDDPTIEKLKSILGSGVAIQLPSGSWAFEAASFPAVSRELTTLTGVEKYVMICEVGIMLRFSPELISGDDLIAEVAFWAMRTFGEEVTHPEISWDTEMPVGLKFFEDLGYPESTALYVAAAAEIVSATQDREYLTKIVMTSHYLRDWI